MLRGLDGRAKGEIEAAGRVRKLAAGQQLFKAGDPADALFVVASGSCVLSGVRRGDADAAVIRRASKGEVLGEEATVSVFATRQLEARCESETVVAEVPLVVLRRAIGRSGGDEVMARVERGLRRSATLDLLRTTSFTRGLSESDLELLLDASRHAQVARGEYVYRAGDGAKDVFVVADGLLQAQSDDEGKPRVEAYLGRGDLFGEEEGTRSLSVVANGPTWLVAIARDAFVSVARRNASSLAAARRLRSENVPPPATNTTAHVFRDLYRMRVARSLLVIDQDACVRCGHCAWSCSDAHADGVSRLVRRGDKIAVNDQERVAPLLVPNSCQHCKNPSCMIDCPTGAIGRDARGEVFIREDLCTGCGSCAKACPWENIQMAPRPEVPPKAGRLSAWHLGAAYAEVAVKCDLCKGVEGGPACVASCPTQAIARVDPNEAFIELRGNAETASTDVPPAHRVVGGSHSPADSRVPAAARAPRVGGAALSVSVAPAPRFGARWFGASSAFMPTRVPAWPWVVFGALAGVAVAGLTLGRWASGSVAGLTVLLLLAYAGTKRFRVRGARVLYVGHLAIGAFVFGVVRAHVGSSVPRSAGGALTIALVATLITGVLGGLIHTFVPRLLSRIERKSVLPEELAARLRELDEKIFAALSGKSELVKTLYRTALRPYRMARFGPFLLIGSRRTLREEEQRLRERLGALAGRATPGVDDLVRHVVEHRAVRAQRLLTWMLRGWLLPHLAVAGAVVVLTALHVYAVTRGVR
jgi:Fe-S-cluster-containing dehydrogenase component/CRP-like cAMP-binding protein